MELNFIRKQKQKRQENTMEVFSEPQVESESESARGLTLN
jgi:hypothetical protein